MPTAPARYGPYHRRATPTQTEEDAAQQRASSQIWGRRPRLGYGLDVAQVKGFIGALPDGVDGVEFWTDVGPTYERPGEARWLPGNPGVIEIDPDHVGIAVVVTLVRYGGEERRLEPEDTPDQHGS